MHINSVFLLLVTIIGEYTEPKIEMEFVKI